jgi:hypothetical protein
MMILSFIAGIFVGAAALAFIALRLSQSKPQETPRFTAPLGAGRGNSLDAHTAFQMNRIFSDLERGRA